jgi:hypothetical protein
VTALDERLAAATVGTLELFGVCLGTRLASAAPSAPAR